MMHDADTLDVDTTLMRDVDTTHVKDQWTALTSDADVAYAPAADVAYDPAADMAYAPAADVAYDPAAGGAGAGDSQPYHGGIDAAGYFIPTDDAALDELWRTLGGRMCCRRCGALYRGRDNLGQHACALHHGIVNTSCGTLRCALGCWTCCGRARVARGCTPADHHGADIDEWVDCLDARRVAVFRTALARLCALGYFTECEVRLLLGARGFDDDSGALYRVARSTSK